jgi:hypothetical protein
MSQPTPPAPEVFFRERLPAQMNRQLAEQQEAAAAAQRALEGMRGVDATLRFDVRGPGGGVWYVNFAAGQAAAGASGGPPPPPPPTPAPARGANCQYRWGFASISPHWRHRRTGATAALAPSNCARSFSRGECAVMVC